MRLESMKLRVDSELRLAIERMGDKGDLRDACEYALLSGGKRLRPLLVLMTANAIGDLDPIPSALSVEYFHTASLIADDLPCMDDDSFRRGRASLHKAFGESVAILASYTLIAGGYGGIYENAEWLKRDPRYASSADARAVLCLEAATRCAGIRGATQGQYLDLHPPDASLETIREIIYKKTVTLFEISFVFGWLFGGGDPSRLESVRKCAYHLGMAFQTADDLLDDMQDAARSSPINIAAACGRDRAMSIFEEEADSFAALLKDLGLYDELFQEVVAWLWDYAPGSKKAIR
jgi:geranylgeranyl diphosphate synthase type II